MSTEAEVVEAVNKVSFRDVQAANGTGPAVDTLSLLGYEKIPKDGKVHSINYDSVSGLDITGAKTGFYQAGSSADFVHKVVRFTGPDSDGKIKCTNGGNITVFFALKKEDDDEGDEGLALQSEEA